MRRLLCLWFPAWPVQRRMIDHPELAGQALAVHAAVARRGRRVVACSSAAAARGVRLQMPLSEAATMRRNKTTPLHLLPHEPEKDGERLAELAEYCERFSPLVGWQTTDTQAMTPETGPDCLLLDVTGVAAHFGGEAALAERVVKSLGRRGCHSCAAVAGTIGAAWGAAHYDDHGQPAAPPHRCVAEAGSEAALLANRPPAALRLGDETLGLLTQLGIQCNRQLAALPRSSLSSRLGDEPLRRWDQAVGAAPESIVAHRPAAQFAVTERLDAPVVSSAHIETLVCQLAERLAQQLRAAGHGADLLQCRLDSVHGQATHLRIGLFEPSDEAEHFQELLRLQLESLSEGRRRAGPLQEGVERIELRAVQASRLVRRQQRLFQGAHDHSRPAARLVDRLRQRLGGDRVFRPRLRADAQPERAYQAEAVGQADSDDQTALLLPLHRPLALSEPQQLTVFSWNDELPREFSWDGRLVEVLRHWGPERIETGWWRGRSIRRDYYRVELRTGERLWLFRQLNNRQWFLHGWYW